MLPPSPLGFWNWMDPRCFTSLVGHIFLSLSSFQEEQFSSISLTGKGKAVGKTVSVAEIIKRKSPGLHQLNQLTEEETVDKWKAKDGKLDTMEIVRYLPVMKITLSKAPIDPATPGYQAPLPPKEKQEAPAQPKDKEKPAPKEATPKEKDKKASDPPPAKPPAASSASSSSASASFSSPASSASTSATAGKESAPQPQPKGPPSKKAKTDVQKQPSGSK